MPAGAEDANFEQPMTALAAALTMLGGYVDAVGYFTLGHVYIANMSGNSIAVGIHSARGEWPEFWKFLWPVISYVTGLLVSRFVVTWGMNAGWRSIVAPAMLVEVGALAGFMYVPSGAGGVFLAASAMGVQSATVARFNGVTVYTCFVTGSLVKFAENFAQFAVEWLRKGKLRLRSGRKAVWFFSIWAAYVIGAILGTTALGHLGHWSVAVAIGCVVALLFIDLVIPASMETTVPKES